MRRDGFREFGIKRRKVDASANREQQEEKPGVSSLADGVL
jgi:hypothetical protein